MTVGSVPASGVAGVQDRIAAIQAQIAALRPPPPPMALVAAPPGSASTAAAGSPGAAFASALTSAVDRQSAALGTTAATGSPSADTSAWVMPAQGRVSSHYGQRHGVAGRGSEFHTGLDIAAPQGTPVRAASGGVVTSAGSDGNYGNAVVIDHGNGVTTRYAHNSALHVRPGQQVAAGDTIAAVGSTGRSTGPHLHFEVRVNGDDVDPSKWLRSRRVSF